MKGNSMKLEKILKCFLVGRIKLLGSRPKHRISLMSSSKKLIKLLIILKKLWKDLPIFHMFKSFKTFLSRNSNLSEHESMNFCRITKKCESASSGLTKLFAKKHKNQSCLPCEKNWRNLLLVWAMLTALKLRLTVL